MKKLYFRLAATNMKNNRQLYLPYLLTGMLSAAMFYIMLAIQYDEGIRQMRGAGNLEAILIFGSYVIRIFVFVFLFYTNSFIIKRRKKEIGIYNILGMEKKHIARELAIEAVFTGIVSTGGGLVAGIVFHKLLMMLLYRITGLVTPIQFYVSGKGVLQTITLFGIIYAAALAYDLLQVKLSNPITLLHGTSAGEREPRTKWLMTALGLCCVAAGYYIAVTTENPLQALTLFFVAVVLVIVGTYSLFTAGSIAVLKLLRKNKRYYYQTRHFTAVSGMIYRMKQNAVGLANICILSTMVLVTVSTTVCMYLGIEDILTVRFPKEVIVTTYYAAMPENPETIKTALDDSLAASGRGILSKCGYLNMSMTAVRREDGFSVTGIGAGTDYSISDVVVLDIVTKADYEKLTGESIAPLEEGEIAIAAEPFYEGEILEFEDRTYTVKESLAYPTDEEEYLASIANGTAYLIVPDDAEFEGIFETLARNWDSERVALNINYNLGYEIDGTSEEKIAAESAVRDAVALWVSREAQKNEAYAGCYIEAREENRAEYWALNGGFLFLGLFLGTMFLMVTVLIIFYKQISEGYEDKERYAIMEKVGMSSVEVKRAIRSQVLTVFFLPIAVAVIHIIMAFPMIKLILDAFSLMNTTLFALCVAGTALVFFLIYLLVFVLTSRSYYKIVGNQV